MGKTDEVIEESCRCSGISLTESLCVCACGDRTNDKDVVELFHTIYLRQQLVDNSVMDSCAAGHAASLLTDGINLIQYDDVKAAVGTKLWNRVTGFVI